MSSASGYNGSRSHFFRTLLTDADTDTDDKNSPNVLQLVPFLSGYACADNETDQGRVLE